MITPKEANRLTEEESRIVGELEKKIDNQIVLAFSTRIGSEQMSVYDHEKQLPRKIIEELIRRYSGSWDISYQPPIYERAFQRTSKGYFIFAEKRK